MCLCVCSNVQISEVLDIYENFCARQSDCMAYLRQLSSDNEIFRSFLSVCAV